MKIFFSGGSGFIGTNLVSDLLTEGRKIFISDKKRSEEYSGLLIVPDVRNKKKLADCMKGSDSVYHLAAEHRDEVRPSSLYYDVNVGGAGNLVYGLI